MYTTVYLLAPALTSSWVQWRYASSNLSVTSLLELELSEYCTARLKLLLLCSKLVLRRYDEKSLSLNLALNPNSVSLISCTDKSKISVLSYKSWTSVNSVSSNLHRFKWAFAQLIFSGVEQCWSNLVKSTQILREIQTVQRFFISSSRLMSKMKSFLGSFSRKLYVL